MKKKTEIKVMFEADDKLFTEILKKNISNKRFPFTANSVGNDVNKKEIIFFFRYQFVILKKWP